MAEMPENEFVEIRYGGYYVRGTRIPLHVLVHASRRGETPEYLLDLYDPYLHSLEKVKGAFQFIQDHPDAIERYLKDEDEEFEKLCREHPMPEKALETFRRMWDEKTRKSA
jgi:uncharacterized protein (DUF433 family)